MSFKTFFIDKATVIVAGWLNDVNAVIYNLLGDGTNPPLTKADIQVSLGVVATTTLAASGGATLVSYLPAGLGAVVRTLKQELDSATGLNLARFTDPITRVAGTTDDSPAFNAALAVLAGLGGGLMLIPDGDWRVNSTVRNTADNVQIKGSGNTRIINGTTNLPAILFGDGITRNYRCGIRNVIFSQVAGVTPVAGNCGLRVQKQGTFTEKDITVYEYPSPLFRGIEYNGVTASAFDARAVQGCLGDGCRFDNFCNDIYFNAVRSDANGGNGFVFRDAQGVYGSNSTAYFNSGFGWDIGSAGTFGNTNYFLANCIGDTNANDNWHISQLLTGKFSQCWGSTQKSTTVNTTAAGWYISGAQIKNLTFVGGDMLFNNGHGMYLNQVDNVSINHISGGIDGNGNGRGGGLSCGLYIDAMAIDVKINGGSYRANSDYGIRIVPGATGTVINTAFFKNNTTGPLFNGATDAVIRNCPGYNPLLGAITTPAMPATTVGVTNTTGSDVSVYISSGTVSSISINGSYVLNGTPATIRLPVAATIQITYSAAPLWKWISE